MSPDFDFPPPTIDAPPAATDEALAAIRDSQQRRRRKARRIRWGIAIALIGAAVAVGYAAYTADPPIATSYKLARQAMDREDYSAALPHLDKVLAENPKYEDARLFRAIALLDANRFEESLADVNLFLEDHSTSASAYCTQSLALGGLCRFKQQLASAHDALAYCTDFKSDSMARTMRADAYYGLGQLDKAQKDLDAAGAFPNDSYDQISANVHLALGEVRKALADATHWSIIAPQAPEPLWLRAFCFQYLKEFDKALADLDEAETRRANSAAGWASRASLFCAWEKYDQAEDYANRALQIDPQDQKATGVRAACAARAGRFEAAAADIHQATLVQPNNVARAYDCRPKHPLTDKDLAHGEQQLAAMLHDRPAMSQHLAKGDALWTWTVRQFAGESLGRRIYWEGLPPSEKFQAQCNPIEDNGRPAIRVRSDDLTADAPKAATFDRLWACAAFELHNIVQAEKSGPQIAARAANRELDENEYIDALLFSEFAAIQECHEFYASIFLPWAKASGVTSSDATCWHALWWPPTSPTPTSRGHLSIPDHRRLYGEYYQTLLIAPLIAELEYRAYIAKANDLVKALEAAEVQAELCNNLAYCHMQLENFDLALRESDRAVKLSPTSSRAHRRRAEVLQAKGQMDDALAAVNTAVQVGQHDAQAYRLRSQIQLARKDAAAALVDAQQAQALAESPDMKTLLTLAAAQAATGDFRQAATTQQQAIELAPANQRQILGAMPKTYQEKAGAKDN